MSGQPQLVLSRRALVAGSGGIAVTWLVGGCLGSGGPSPDGAPTVIASGSGSGVYDHYARAWSAVAGRRAPLRVVSTTGSVQNIHLLLAGTVGLAFCALDAAAVAWRTPPPDGSAALRALGRLYDDYMHLAVIGGSAITAIADLRGRRVCVGAPNSGTTLISDRLLTVSGIDPVKDIDRVQLSLDDSVTALRAGGIDAFFWSGGLPTLAVTNLAADLSRGAPTGGAPQPLRLISLADPARRLRDTYGTTYRIGAIPGHTYPGVPAAVPTLAVPNVLLTMTALPRAEATRLIRQLFTDAPRIGRTVPVATQLDRQTAIFTEPVPLHPGAIDYYRSVAIDV